MKVYVVCMSLIPDGVRDGYSPEFAFLDIENARSYLKERMDEIPRGSEAAVGVEWCQHIAPDMECYDEWVLVCPEVTIMLYIMELDVKDSR